MSCRRPGNHIVPARASGGGGRAGDTLQNALSPVFEGVMLAMGVPCVNVNGEPV